MTCRNYIPGPDGDCQRCGEMGINHAGTGYTLDEIMAAAQSGEIDRARAMFNASVKFRCGEMIAGHAGRPAALHEALGVLYSRLHEQMSPAERHELLEAITILKVGGEMRAGHAGPTLYPMRAWHAGSAQSPAIPAKLEYSRGAGGAAIAYVDGWNDCIEKMKAINK